MGYNIIITGILRLVDSKYCTKLQEHSNYNEVFKLSQK